MTNHHTTTTNKTISKLNHHILSITLTLLLLLVHQSTSFLHSIPNYPSIHSHSHHHQIHTHPHSSSTKIHHPNNNKPMKATTTHLNTMKKVAVIGGGAAGLATARALSKKGLMPRVLEKGDTCGGVWRYEAKQKREDIGDVSEETVVGRRPMYKGLRTNLPREIMAFREMPWGGDGVTMSYVTHQEVANYLQEYKNKFDLDRFVSYNCNVTHLRVCDPTIASSSTSAHNWSKITLSWDTPTTNHSETFDAVCICNGHYAVPSTPSLPGLQPGNNFSGRTLHSVDYDDPSEFEGQTVLCIGGRASGADLAREISAHATKVYVSDTTCPSTEPEGSTEGNVVWVPKTLGVTPEGEIWFADPCVLRLSDVDAIIFCTGYDYSFPFIDTGSNLHVTSDRRRVTPLYEQLWHAEHPSVAFVGIPHSVVPFSFFEVQAEAVAHQLNGGGVGERLLPGRDERVACARKDAEGGGPNGGRVEDTHFLGGHQWNWLRTYAEYAGGLDDDMERFVVLQKAIYDDSGKRRKEGPPGGPDTYRYNSYVKDEAAGSFTVAPVDLAKAMSSV